ncbi:hypothetical protein SteCoe_35543 [Stentor coeruleus]|uniref:Uncharacterized protein n=1 Tax=Stentor coeruleus TaxID=5963 RepID=A0A1R2AS96_9CILI|nr:hypothetical protein SteCoe_35543 [Stentor coeruleus]
MVLIVIFISIAQGLVTFLSPDVLRNLTLPYAVPFFTKVEFMQRYGKLIFAGTTDCKVDGKFKENEVVVVFSKDIGDCYLYDVAQSAEMAGGGAFFAVVSETFYDEDGNFNQEYEWEDEIDDYELFEGYSYYSEEDKSLNIFCLVLLDGHSILKKYETQPPIWIQYSYNYLSRTKSTDFKFGLTEDFKNIDIFFSELEGFAYSFEIYIYNLDLFLINAYSTEISSEEEINDEQCVKVNVNSYKIVSICLYTYDDSTGYEKLMVITLVLNYYYSFSSTDYIYDFLNFLNSLKISCYNKYTISCISDVLVEYGAVPNLDTYILYQHNIDKNSPHYFYKINNVFIYTTGVMESTYIIANTYEAKHSNFYIDECDDGCSYIDLFDSICTDKCNTSKCSYDNLNCIQNNECFTFMLGDGYCNSVCSEDPDCKTNDSDDNDYFLIVVIVIPIFAGLLIIIIALFIIYILYSKKKNEKSNKDNKSKKKFLSSIKKITFNENLSYKGEALCTIDLKAIVAGESVVIMDNCCHIYHFECVSKRYEIDNILECLLCHQESSN